MLAVAGSISVRLAQWGGTAASLLGNPWVGLALSLGGSLVDSFMDNPYDKAREQIIKDRQQRMADQRRKARGEFNPAEQQQISNSPALEQITENVAQAGLEGSGVGQQVLADAAVQAYEREQALATAELNDLETSTYDMLSGMITDDPGFGTMLGNISAFAQEQQAAGKRDAMFEQAMKANENLINEFQLLLTELAGGT